MNRHTNQSKVVKRVVVAGHGVELRYNIAITDIIKLLHSSFGDRSWKVLVLCSARAVSVIQ